MVVESAEKDARWPRSCLRKSARASKSRASVRELRRAVPLALLTALAVTGTPACGSNSDAPDKSHTARKALLGLSDLPPGSKTADKPIVGDKCSPASYFRGYAREVQTPPGFHMNGADLLQNVGVFADEHDARRAFAAITSQRSRSCIAGELQRAAREAGVKGEPTSEEVDRRLPGAKIHVMRVDLSVGFSTVHVERTAILDGRAVSTLTFISRNKPVRRAYWDSLVPKATGRLADAMPSS